MEHETDILNKICFVNFLSLHNVLLYIALDHPGPVVLVIHFETKEAAECSTGIHFYKDLCHELTVTVSIYSLFCQHGIALSAA